MFLAPDRNRVSERGASCVGQEQPSRAAVFLIRRDADEAAPLERFQRGGERRAIHGEEIRKPPQCRRLRDAKRHHQRELPIGEAKRREGAVEAAREKPRGALRRKAETGVANLMNDLDRRFLRHGFFDSA